MGTINEIQNSSVCAPHSEISSLRPRYAYILFSSILDGQFICPEDRMNVYPILNKAIPTQNKTISLDRHCLRMKIKIFLE